MNRAEAAMITVDEAVVRARKQMEMLFPEFTQRDLRLEEAETPLRGGEWRFTFSSAVPADAAASAGSVAELFAPRRIRKVVELEPDSGSLIAIKAA